MINSHEILQVLDNENTVLEGYQAKNLYVLNTDTNERYEIAPDKDKYFISDIGYASQNRNYCMYTTAEILRKKSEDGVDMPEQILLKFYRHRTGSEEDVLVGSFATGLKEFHYSVFLRLFVLSENIILVQEETKNFSAGKSDFRLFLKDCEQKSTKEIQIPQVIESGIYNIMPVSETTAAVKFGRPYITDTVAHGLDKKHFPTEFIGIINVNQFISELSMNMENLFTELLDESTETTTFPYIRHMGKRLIYSKYDTEKSSEELIIYDTETQTKKVRISNNHLSRMSDLFHSYLINDTPYLFREEKKHTYIINLDTGKTVMRLDSDTTVCAVADDLVVVTEEMHKFFSKKKATYVEVYHFPEFDKNPIVSIRGSYLGSVNTGEKMVVFTA